MRPSHWLLAGLAALAAGCPASGPTAERDLPDRDLDGVPNELDCAPDDSGHWRVVAAYVDNDWDGHGAGTPVSLCTGADVFGGYAEDGTDCDDARWDVWQLADYYSDADHDGVGTGDRVAVCSGAAAPSAYADAAGDCAPDDGARWRELAYLYVDGDHDGHTLPGAGVACSGASLPVGYAMDPSGVDCDDADAAAFVNMEGYADADLDGYGMGAAATLCTGGTLPSGYGATLGDCAPADGARWQDLLYSWVDLDGDGYTTYASGVVCSGWGLPTEYREAPSPYGTDCDDGDRNAWEEMYAYPDGDRDRHGVAQVGAVCTDGWLPGGWVADLFDGVDCDDADPSAWRLQPYSQRDADSDGYTVWLRGELCVGATLPAGYGDTPSAVSDCDDADPSVFRALSGGLDADHDGYGAPPRQGFCTAGSLPAGYVTDATDCDDTDQAVWRAYADPFADRDGDGYTVQEAAALCIGDSLPPPYLPTANGNDCDDADPTAYRRLALYADTDGDGVGAPPRWIPCLGATLPAGWSVLGYDEDDNNSAIQADDTAEELLIVLD